MKFNLLALSIFIFNYLIFSQTTFFIKYKDGINQEKITDIVSKKNVFIDKNFPNKKNEKIDINYLAKGLGLGKSRLSKIIKVSTETNLIQQDYDRITNNDTDIEYIQTSTVYKIDFVPNDSLISQQWALSKIDAFSAWNISKGSPSVLIGVVDTGIDYLHPDLKNKIFINPGETGTDTFGNDKKYNNIDDDNNGFIDDYMGWDFTDRVGFPFDSTGGDYLNWDNNPMDENSYSHGTAVSGIIGAETNNKTGVAGVAPNIKILNLRAFDPGGYGEEDDVAAAILYAVQMGVKVINMSFGDNSFSLVLKDVIQYAYSQNVVLVASSGNSGSVNPHYPSGYSEVICVGNSTQDDYVSSSSNYGSTLDLVAPGTGILTTIRNNNYSLFYGTSAAAPFVSAVAGMILSIQNFSNEEVKQIIKTSSDDIEQPGWDLKSGAGRVNLFKSLNSLAPAKIKFDFPKQDFATKSDSIEVYATALSPYFVSCDLFYGVGLNPTSWNTLMQNRKNQFANSFLSKINLSSFGDTVFTLRLVVYQTNGRTMEERVNFHHIKTPPKGEIVSVGPAYYGEKATIMSAVYTFKPATVKMFYRESGTQNFSFVSLDGFATNNQFVSQLHYGFIPKQIVKPNTVYEIYFQLENLVGLTTLIKDSSNNFFQIKTDDYFNLIPYSEMTFSLPPGIIFDQPVNFTTNVKNELFIRENSNSRVTNLYQLQNNSFVKLDTLYEKIPKEFGDFNSNGKKDLLSYWYYNSYLYEQDNINSSKLIQKTKKDSSMFWPIMAKDINKDGFTELLAITNDTTVSVYKVNSDLSLKYLKSITNFTRSGLGYNLFDSPNGLIADINGDGINELWMVDMDGDIFSYEFYSDGTILKDKQISTGYAGSSAYLAYGDYDGDGRKDIAVLLHSISSIDIASYHLLTIFTFIGNQLHIIYNNAFIDAATEFKSAFQNAGNSLKFADIDNDGKEELILFTFPYSYILKRQTGKDKIIFFEENINSNSILISDLNQNGVLEVALPTDKKIKFYEFGNSNSPQTPIDVAGYSIDNQKVKLTWNSPDSKFYIYKGNSANNLLLFDSTNLKYYIDSNNVLKKEYYYGVKAYNPLKIEPYSQLSRIIKVYHHQPAKILSVEIKNNSSLILHFTEKMNNTIENIQAIYLADSFGNIIFPNSISSSNQYSYLVSFKNVMNGNYKLFINGLKDIFSSPIQFDSIQVTFSIAPVSEMFFVESYEILSPYKVKIVFNKEYDMPSATNGINYSFQPENKVVSFNTLQGNKEIILDLANVIGSVGREYRLKISNVFSSLSTGKVNITDGAGSVILLTSYAKDLSDVYFYPSPAKITNENSTLTFANLPRYAEITIWALNGNRIITLDEKDGNGGVSWNLKDLDGKQVNSGIYLYRIVQYDDKKNEVGNKLGKIAIVK